MQVQYLDQFGKRRGFKSGSLYCFSLPSIPLNNIPVESFESAKFVPASTIPSEFPKPHAQSLSDNDKTCVIWTFYESQEILIPVTERDPLQNVPFDIREWKSYLPFVAINSNPPPDTKRLSTVAMYLKSYTLFYYSLLGEPSAQKFTEMFVIEPNHVWDIEKLNKRIYFEGNNIMFRGDKLIVTSERMRDRLVNFVRVAKMNDAPGVKHAKNTRYIPYFSTLENFTTSPTMLVFDDKTQLFAFRNEKLRSADSLQILTIPLGGSLEPYFLQLPFATTTYLTQNPDTGKRDDAIRIAYEWFLNKRNMGYKGYLLHPVFPADISFLVYNEKGIILERVGEIDKALRVLRYENGTYGALLPF